MLVAAVVVKGEISPNVPVQLGAETLSIQFRHDGARAAAQGVDQDDALSTTTRGASSVELAAEEETVNITKAAAV